MENPLGPIMNYSFLSLLHRQFMNTIFDFLSTHYCIHIDDTFYVLHSSEYIINFLPCRIFLHYSLLTDVAFSVET